MERYQNTHTKKKKLKRFRCWSGFNRICKTRA
jgi:hypothetical protein